MPVANECLRWCEPPVLVLEARLNNTLAPDYGFADMAGGLVPTASFNDSITFASDAVVKISTGKAKNSGSSQVVLKGVQYRRSLAPRFTGGTSSSLSKLFINHLAGNDQLYARDWQQKDYTLKVGGKFKPNTAYADILRYSEYPTWIQGRVLGKDFDERSMGVFFDTEPRQLSNLFPSNKVVGGVSEGQTIPFVIGHVRIMSPVLTGTGETTGQFHDGACEGVLAAYDLDGNTLTLEAGDPLTATVTAATKYMADNLGNVAWHSSINGVALEVKGARIDGVYSGAANELIAEMVKIATSSAVPVNYDFDGKPIGWVFYEQAPIKDHINTILDGIDCFYSEVETDNSITIRRRYNARINNLDGVANERDSFTFGEVGGVNKNLRQIQAAPRPQRVTVRYNRNFSPLSNILTPSANRLSLIREWDIKTDAVSDGREAEKVIDCAYTVEADAAELSRMAADIYGLKAFIYTWVEPVIGLGLLEGDVGNMSHLLITNNVKAEIQDITVDTSTNKTSIQAIIYG